jgi:hypothetical protein
MGGTCMKTVFGDMDFIIGESWDQAQVVINYKGLNKNETTDYGNSRVPTSIVDHSIKQVMNIMDKDFLRTYSHFNSQFEGPEVTNFVDPKFPPNETSLIFLNQNNEATKDVTTEELDLLKKFKWKRVSEIMKNYVLYDEIGLEDIHQGQIGNCYFLSAVCAIAEFKERFDEIFISKNKSNNGCYQVKLVLQGVPTLVYIDDYFPTYNNWFAGVTSGQKEIWVQVLEKAWAKINDSYASTIAGLPGEALAALTVAPVFSYIHRKFPDERKNELWKIIKDADDKNYIICTNTGSNKDAEALGLVESHAYTIIGVYERENLRLVKLRNPWGQFEWKGDFSDKSSKWQQYPGLKEEVQFKNHDDGIFYMTFEDFLQYYPYTFICKYENGYFYNFKKVEQAEKNRMTCAKIILTKPTKICVSLHQKQQRFYRKVSSGYKPQMARIIIAKFNSGKYEFIGSDSNDNEKLHIDLEKAEPGEYHIFANVTWNLDTPCRYVISTYSNENIQIERLEAQRVPNDFLLQILDSYMTKFNVPSKSLGDKFYKLSINDNDLGFYMFSLNNTSLSNSYKFNLNIKHNNKLNFLSSNDISNKTETVVERTTNENFDVIVNNQSSKMLVWKLNDNPWQAKLEPLNLIANQHNATKEDENIDYALIKRRLHDLNKQNISLSCIYSELEVEDAVYVLFENQSPQESGYKFKVEFTLLKNLKSSKPSYTFEIESGNFKVMKLSKINVGQDFNFTLRYSFRRI